jgi:hypothetical protein
MNKEAHGYTIASKGKRLIATLVEGIIFGTLFYVSYRIFGGHLRNLLKRILKQ